MTEAKVTTIPEFNPSGNATVATIKEATEKIILFIQNAPDLDPRRKAIALTNYEQAAMWAVKACFP